ncbi:glycoside hydrolase family 30 protein [Podospora fimiseda]|uniref:Glycoside hydrolase family 30 protein n=1 Tax=Podospora fimiseda TaxID=252190 RepID=A0AAN7BLD9_9PEZI|nr:glycoside hydrolase family 30 protein [Podospora fimiseda]
MGRTIMDKLAILLALIAANFSSVNADLTTIIDAKSNRGTWEGWGTSLAWWAVAFGNRQSLPGLGFNIARYNADVSSWNSYNGSKMVVSPNMIPSRQVEGFWQDWGSADPSSSSWKWSADANQRSMLSKAQDRGADILELFSVSPMWWMCKNHNPSGSDDGSSDNLQSWKYQQHALYLATVAKYAADNWNIRFQSVEPFNQPSANWWNGGMGTQEGCHFEASTQETVLGYLGTELRSRGLSSVISASDESYYDEALTTFNRISSSTMAESLPSSPCHRYQWVGGRDSLYSTVSRAGKKLWQSELVSNLLLDMRWLRPTAWVYWQALDRAGGWGLIDADNDKKTIGSVNQKYFVLAQFARHIRPGMRILDGGSDYTVAAYDATTRKLVVIAVNWGDAQYINFDLSKFSTPGVNDTVIKRWTTQIESGSRYVERSDTPLDGTKFWSRFEKNMVQTFEITVSSDLIPI